MFLSGDGAPKSFQRGEWPAAPSWSLPLESRPSRLWNTMNDRLSSNSGPHGTLMEGPMKGPMEARGSREINGWGSAWRRVLAGVRRELHSRGLGGRAVASRGPVPFLLKVGEQAADTHRQPRAAREGGRGVRGGEGLAFQPLLTLFSGMAQAAGQGRHPDCHPRRITSTSGSLLGIR